MASNKVPLPDIDGKESFDCLVQKLARYITSVVDRPTTFEEFRTSQSYVIFPLVKHMNDNIHHQAIVAALLALKGHFDAVEDEFDRGIDETRGYACEAVALRFVTHLSDREIIDALLYELPDRSSADDETQPQVGTHDPFANEHSPLIRTEVVANRSRLDMAASLESLDGARAQLAEDPGSDFAIQFEGLNALEIAAVCQAKKLLSQRAIQQTITAIWDGDIVFWTSLSANATKHAQVYQRKASDPYSRLRVPKYLKAFEVMFFIAFLAFYYVVLYQRSFYIITVAEIFLYIWIAGFGYNELGEYWDAGTTTFYFADFWTLWDVGIVAIGAAFFIARTIGLAQGNDRIIDTSFDILSMEALFLVPRICSLLSLNPYFGTLIPCLKEMTKDFVKFLGLVIILYLGFLTTFSLLARGYFTFREMSWILIKVFFGSSYLGFDVAEKISPVLGPPLMLIFVTLTNILLITSLISILSNSLSKVIEHAREEYLFVYSVFVLEAATSNRLTFFLPPLNLIALLFRPFRLFVSAETLRNTRILLLKITHTPHVLAITLYERISQYITDRRAGKRDILSGTGTRSSIRKAPMRKDYLRSPRPLSAANLRYERNEPLDEEPQPSEGPQQTSRRGSSQADMEAMLDQLASQVEALKAMLARRASND